jgi:hypothetical protein
MAASLGGDFEAASKTEPHDSKDGIDRAAGANAGRGVDEVRRGFGATIAI